MSAAGCASRYQLSTVDAPPSAAAEAPSGQVCVVRPSWVGGYLTVLVRDNGRLVGATTGETCFCHLAGEGRHRITSEDDARQTATVRVERATLTVTPGKRSVLVQELSE